jgi:hypothetical protein
MKTTITYDTVKALIANPPSIGDRPNFFNLCALGNHFAPALKRITCPQSKVNGWGGFVISPAMFLLINPTPFNMVLLNVPNNSGVPELPEILDNVGNVVPYTRKQILRITATFQCQKNYYDTACNIYRAVYDTLDAHIDNAFKVAPTITPPTIGWNLLMTLNDIFDQMMRTYGRRTPDAMRQDMMTFLSPYNPYDPPELLYKCCADCQEVAIIANVKYTNQQLLMNVINLLIRCGIYQRDLNNWDQKLDTDKTWLNLRSFIQEAYQHRLASDTMIAGQGGYALRNRFTALAANGTAVTKEVSDDDTTKTIAGTMNSHMEHLSQQTPATLEANANQIKTSLQQLASNNEQLHQQQQVLMPQMAMLTTNANVPRTKIAAGGARTNYPAAIAHPPTQIYAPPLLQGFQQQQPYYPPRGGGCGGGCSRQGGHGCGHGQMPPPQIQYPTVGETNIIPYIPTGFQPHQCQCKPNFLNIVKVYANQNKCFLCGFDVEDGHTSATCVNKKMGHQDGFTCSKYMEYKRVNHLFCRKGMHKTMYPSNF